jgi:hypothetical protein
MNEQDFAQLEELRKRYKDYKPLSQDAEAWAEREAWRVLQEQNAALVAANHEYKAAITEIYVNVREIRKAAIGKDSESIRDTFFGMTDEILVVTTKALKGKSE